MTQKRTNPLARLHQNHMFFPVVMALTLVLACLPIRAAHAGFFEWLDEATTFNEEQKRPLKPDVLPKGPPAPLLYDGQKANQWNQFYTREDLEPTRHMKGSGTMVMRPKGVIEAQEKGQVLDRNGRAVLGPNGDPISKPELLQRRAALNKAREQANKRDQFHVGEPDRMPSRRRGANVGVKTQIGAPVKDWRQQHNQPMEFAPQPGDFDYPGDYRSDARSGQNQRRQNSRARVDERTRRQRNQFDDLQTFTNPPSQQQGQQRGQQRGRQQDQRFGQRFGQRFEQQGGQQRGQFDAQFNREFPNKYTVQEGDTLSGISDKDRIYGDWQMWPLIHDANRSQISHPDRIRPQQRFDIPRDYTVDDVEGARNRSLPPYDWAQ